ncbi:MAG: hypothetical protein K9J47_11315 [Sulfuritalea sp.]|jgi:hypothetical protein|nr:hypothetical protein [Polynucleobacter sp.]MCF8189349.1 hypothetical protein [Sulfuritalea sp.]
MTKTKRFMIRSVLASALGLGLLSSADATVYRCTIKKIRGNEFVCREFPNLCNFVFIVDESSKKISRKDEEDKKLVKVVTDKWDEKLIIAHEDQNRIDNRFIEQYYYKIELGSGNFLMANEYMTNTGRYLTQEDIDMADKRTFSYNKPKLFSEKGSCNLKAKD